MRDSHSVHPNLAELTAFDRGQLQSAEREAVERHIAVCDTCCSRLDGVGDDDLIALLRTSAGPMSRVEASDTCALPADTPRPADKDDDTALPDELIAHPRYRVLGLLGAGGMGVVFKAEHRLMERTVALKILHKALTERPGSVERFRQEVKAAARLSHANIVTAYDAEQAGESHFLVMELIKGQNLDDVVRAQGPLPVALACDIARQVALGLQHAHERGMVHRDIKPHNLLLTPAGQVKILDFGLARFRSENSAGALTDPGVIVGTPDYIAPEQALDARQADIRADIYGLGCTLYFLLAGRPPFPDGSALQKLMAHQHRTPPMLTDLRPDVPGELLRVIERMMAKNLAQRFQTPGQIADHLASFTGGDTPPSVSAPSHPQMVRDDGSTLAFSKERSAKAPRRPTWRTARIAAPIVLLALLLCGLAWWRMHGRSQNVETEDHSISMEKEPLADFEIRRVGGRSGPFTRAVLAADCRRALVAGLDFNVSLWDLEKENAGGAIGQLKGHAARPMSFAFSRDGRRVLSGGMDNTVRLWDLDERQLIRTFEKHTSWVRGVDFVDETDLAVSGDNHGRVLLWDTRDGQLVHTFAGHEGVVYSIQASRSARLAVTSSGDRTVRVWNLTLLHEDHCLRGHEDNSTCAVLSNDDRFVLSGSADHTVRFWERATEKTLHVLRGHTATVNVVALSSDGRRALSGDQAGFLRLWELEKGEELRCYSVPGQIIRAVAFCPDGRRILSADDGGMFHFWHLP